LSDQLVTKTACACVCVGGACRQWRVCAWGPCVFLWCCERNGSRKSQLCVCLTAFNSCVCACVCLTTFNSCVCVLCFVPLVCLCFCVCVFFHFFILCVFVCVFFLL